MTFGVKLPFIKITTLFKSVKSYFFPGFCIAIFWTITKFHRSYCKRQTSYSFITTTGHQKTNSTTSKCSKCSRNLISVTINIIVIIHSLRLRLDWDSS